MNLDYRRFRFTLATFCSSQYLKELFVSCFLSLSIFPPVSPLESGCKGKACFSFSKLFKLFFQTFFPAPRLTSFPRALSLESGCKDKAMIHHFPNFFTVFFHLFFKKKTPKHWLAKCYGENFFHGTCRNHGKKSTKTGHGKKRAETIGIRRDKKILSRED